MDDIIADGNRVYWQLKKDLDELRDLANDLIEAEVTFKRAYHTEYAKSAGNSAVAKKNDAESKTLGEWQAWQNAVFAYKLANKAIGTNERRMDYARSHISKEKQRMFIEQHNT